MLARFLGQIRLSSQTFQIRRTDGAYSTRTVALDDGNYYWADDGEADDLLDHINTEVQAAGAELANFDVMISTSGLIGMKMGTGQTATVTWDPAGSASATTLRDWMRYSGATTGLTASYTYGARCAAYAYYPAKAVVEDLPVKVEQKSVSVADDGTAEVHHYGQHIRRICQLRFAGAPEASTWTEHYALEDFWDDVFRIGRPFRWYRDLTEDRPWVRYDTPTGYRTWMLLAPNDWEPIPLQAGWYDHFEKEFLFQLVS